MPTNTKVEYVIFDMDGLLIDSEKIHTVVANNILQRFGKVMTWDIKAGCMAEWDSAVYLLSFFPDLPEDFTIVEFLKELREGQQALWPTVQPLPGVVRLVQHLHRHKIPIAIATGSQRFKYGRKSSHLMDNLFRYFEGKVVCADDGLIKSGRGKPHPDIFLATASTQLRRDVGEGEESESHITDGQRAERARGLVFEDAIAGIRAGKRAGMRVVWVPDPNLIALRNRGEESVAPIDQPDQILESLEHFVPEQWGLPPYDS
ncbi:HAD-like protein [Irpex rosettiformis]|uniref:HAD-like protein n=1 Tax=Irpex rosettiformis TaxID=378272 RepID=A0ACB8U182_9APHY|nr:HAD-like protein [Irpex rosettiformis]